MDVLILIIICLALFFLYFYLALEFYDVAKMKGFTSKKYFWLPFLTIPGYLLIIALPDRNQVQQQNDSQLPKL